MIFQCNRCGLCCMHLDASGMSTKLDRGDGVCIHFDEQTKLCKIYENRPLICSVDRFYEEKMKETMTREVYYELNYKSCCALQKKYGSGKIR